MHAFKLNTYSKIWSKSHWNQQESFHWHERALDQTYYLLNRMNTSININCLTVLCWVLCWKVCVYKGRGDLVFYARKKKIGLKLKWSAVLTTQWWFCQDCQYACYLGCFLTDSCYITLPAESNITGTITHQICSLFLRKLRFHTNDTKIQKLTVLLLCFAPPV